MVYILVDSSSDIDIRTKENYKFVPITVCFGDKSYQDGVDLNKDTFYKLLTENDDFPKTAHPSPETNLSIFEKVKAQQAEIVCLLLSSGLSGNYQSALIAKQMVDYDKIHIVDTRSLTYGIVLLSHYADKLRAQGKSGKEIADACDILKEKIRLVAGLDTLEYLQKGGRISRASAAVGTMANIKPVLTITPEGTVQIIAKSMGRVRAMQAILKFISENPIDPEHNSYSVYTLGEENAAEMERKFDSCGITNYQRGQVGSTIGAHAGPGVYGLIYIAK